MKRIVLAVGASLLLCAGMAEAQIEPATLVVSFTPAPTTTADFIKDGVVPFVPFDVFVLSYAVPGGLEAYEFSLNLPAGAIPTQGRILPLGATDFGVGDDNWIVGTSGVCHGEVGWFTLVRYGGVLFLAPIPVNSTICPHASVPSSFVDDLPGYLSCAAPGEIMSFALLDFMPLGPSCAILNWTGVPTAATSFGALKAWF